MNPSPLVQLFTQFPYIQEMGEGQYAPWIGGGKHNFTQHFTREDVSLLDARLLTVIDHEMSIVKEKGGVAIIACRVLNAALTAWDEPAVVELRTLDKSNNSEAVPIHRVYGITTTKREEPVIVHALTTTWATTPCGLTYADWHHVEKLHIDWTVLDTAFPDWENKFEVALALSLSPRETAEMVFSKARATHDVDLSTVTFD